MAKINYVPLRNIKVKEIETPKELSDEYIYNSSYLHEQMKRKRRIDIKSEEKLRNVVFFYQDNKDSNNKYNDKKLKRKCVIYQW